MARDASVSLSSLSLELVLSPELVLSLVRDLLLSLLPDLVLFTVLEPICDPIRDRIWVLKREARRETMILMPFAHNP